MPNYFSTTATLAGATRLIRMFRPWAEQDGAGKMQGLISQVNALISTVTVLQNAAVSANVSATTFSALSGLTFTTLSSLSNFSST
jgi:hypothetical protein